MIYGIGTDIVNIERIKRLIDLYNIKFIRRILSEPEIALLPAVNSHNFIAGRFAAKEAVIKAMGERHNLAYNEIEILRDHNNKPYFNNVQKIKDILISHSSTTQLIIHVSISHDGDYAAAFAIIETV